MLPALTKEEDILPQFTVSCLITTLQLANGKQFHFH